LTNEKREGGTSSRKKKTKKKKKKAQKERVWHETKKNSQNAVDNQVTKKRGDKLWSPQEGVWGTRDTRMHKKNNETKKGSAKGGRDRDEGKVKRRKRA